MQKKTWLWTLLVGCFASILGIIFIKADGQGNFQQQLDELRNKLVPVGTIIASMLPPNEFRELYGSVWVLANGQDRFANEEGEFLLKADSEYGRILCKDIQNSSECTLPDLRGMFLRGINMGRSDGLQDPEGERQAKSFQDDSFESHTHELTQPVLCHRDYCGATGEDLNSGGWASHQKVPLTSVGGSETRPKNVAVYYYIKIN
jgi:hypothetical protein